MSLFCKHLASPFTPKVVLLLGGDDPALQEKKLKEGVDILVASLAKIMDFISKKRVLLSETRFLVLDEADALLHSDKRGVETLWGMCPKISRDGRSLQTIVCSATLSNFLVRSFTDRCVPHANWIDLKGQDTVPATVHQVVCHIDPSKDTSWRAVQKTMIPTDGVHDGSSIGQEPTTPQNDAFNETHSFATKLLKMLYTERAIRTQKMDQVIVFCRTKLDCDNMEKYFTSLGGGPKAPRDHQFSCRCLHAGKLATERNQNLIDFKQKKYCVMICTAVAARGLDIQGVPYLISVTVPDEPSTYVHMIGRVGRADRMGLAVQLVSDSPEKVWYHVCKKPASCKNKRLRDEGGCCLWYHELQLLAGIETHLKETIESIPPDTMNIPVNVFDGKVVYGTKRNTSAETSTLTDHAKRVHAKLATLTSLETTAQLNYFKLRSTG